MPPLLDKLPVAESWAATQQETREQRTFELQWGEKYSGTGNNDFFSARPVQCLLGNTKP